jgi:hypothetical protein
MYIGHAILIMVLVGILLIAFFVSQRGKQVFTYACRGIAIVFVFISFLYCYDVFINNPSSEGYEMTDVMYFLTQNEDFLLRNGKFFGLFWGIGIAAVSFLISLFPGKHDVMNLSANK